MKCPRCGLVQIMPVADAERKIVLAAFERWPGNVPRVAKAAGLSARTTYRKLHAYGVYNPHRA